VVSVPGQQGIFNDVSLRWQNYPALTPAAFCAHAGFLKVSLIEKKTAVQNNCSGSGSRIILRIPLLNGSLLFACRRRREVIRMA
jgi:hypothetical protein